MSTKERQHKSRLSELSAEVEQLETKLSQADAAYDEGRQAYQNLQTQFEELDSYSEDLEDDLHNCERLLQFYRAEGYWHRLWNAITGESV